ncbi:MAG: TolC family protein [Bdellovibrionales bacterium]|nr:TolC family protein [Bdellovibrionales bacterium]
MILFFFPLLASAQTVNVKFEDIKRLVETRNERIQASVREVSAAKARQGHLERSFLPRLEAHAAQEGFKTGTQEQKTQPEYGAELNLNLYNGGRDRLQERVLAARAARKDFEMKGKLAGELAKARETYWNIVYANNVSRVLKEMNEVNSANLKAANRRLKSGVATESDRLEFEMNAIDLKRDLSQIELDRRSSSRDLLVLLGYEPSQTLQTETELKHGDEWESEIRHTHEDHEFLVKPAQLLSTEADLAAREASRFWLPRLDAYAGWNQYNQREEEPSATRERQESVVGLRLKFGPFDGLTARSESAALRMEASAAKLIADYEHKRNEAHIEKEFDELKFLHDRVHEADENIASAERYYRLTQAEYTRGVKNSPDVLGASEKLLAMRMKRLNMIRDFQIARSHVLSKIGK